MVCSTSYYSTSIKQPCDFCACVFLGDFSILCGEKALGAILILTKVEGSEHTVQMIRLQEEEWRKEKLPNKTYRDVLYGRKPLVTSTAEVHLPCIWTHHPTPPPAHTVEHTVQTIHLQEEEEEEEEERRKGKEERIHRPRIWTHQLTLPQSHRVEHTVQMIHRQQEERKKEEKKKKKDQFVR